MTCNYCGIREACIMAISQEPRKERPRLLLCQKCWEEKWSTSKYQQQPIVSDRRCIIPPRPLLHRNPAVPGPYLRA